MSKKAILSALLVSSALLGTTAAANAATSAVKPESKLVTVEKEGAKLYKNSKLDASTTTKVGTVYKVDGYREINKKHYYRVYQQDKNGKNVYKGYLLNKDAKDLKAGAVAKKDRFVGVTAEKAPAWKNLYFNRKIKTYNGVEHSSNFEVKHTYKLGNKTYFSMYRGEKWMGYMDASQVKVLTPKAVAEDKQAYKVVEDWNTYNDIYFTEKGTLTKGDKVTVKRIYTFSTGRQYGSLYNAEGKWIGYANMKALTEDKAVDAETQKAIDAANDAIKKAEEILGKAQATKDSKDAAQKVIDAAKETVKNGSLEDIKKVPAQITEAIKALKPIASSMDIQKIKDAIDRAEEAIKAVQSQGTGSVDKAKIDKVKAAIEEGKKVIAATKDGNVSMEDADKAAEAINKAVNDLGAPATTVDVERLEAAIKEAEGVLNNSTDGELANRAEIQKAVDEGKKVLDAAKKGEANGKEVQDATKAIEDALNNSKVNREELAKKVQDIKKLADDVYMTKAGEDKFNKAMADITNIADGKGSFDDLLKAENILDEARKGLLAQPNKEDGEALAKAIQATKELAKLPNKGEDLYGAPALKDAYEKADKLMTELKKDAKTENTATEKISKADVTKATEELNKALENLGLNEEALNTFIEAAKTLKANDSKLANDKDFAAAVTNLEALAKNPKLSKYQNIVTAAQKVYDMMVQDLQTVLNGVLPWNNNSTNYNPAVTVKDFANALPTEEKYGEIKNNSVKVKGGDNALKVNTFVETLVTNAPKVGYYYDHDRYAEFVTAIENAQKVINSAKGTKAATKGSAKELANQGPKVLNSIKALYETQQNLRYSKYGLAIFADKASEAKTKWFDDHKGAVAEKKAAQAAPNATQKLQAQANVGNTGAYRLTSWLEKATDADFKPTLANKKALMKKVYEVENYYYQFITQAPSSVTSPAPAK